MSDYLHGVETVVKDDFSLTITDADISSVVIIGTAPTYLIDSSEELPKITNTREVAAYLGNNIDGFTLPDAALTVLTESGGADIYTINIFDEDSHTSSASVDLTFSNGTCTLEETGIYNLVLTQNDTELTLDTDYSFEDNVITVLSGGAIETDQTGITASYDYADFTKITDSDVIGTTDSDDNRTGAQRIYDIVAEYGIVPGIIIAPGFTSKNVKTALETIAEDLRGFVYFDVPKGTTITTAETARTTATDDVDLTGTSEYSMLCMPYVYRYNSYQDTTTLKPLSPVLAGLRVRLDRNRNVAKSISNTASKTITGTEYPIYFRLNKSGTDSNRLNEIGITTVVNIDGDYTIWGTRNSSYPSNTGIMTFENSRRVRNYINETVESSTLSAVDENITRGFIDNVINAINAKFASWSNPSGSNYIIYDGAAYYDETLNTADTLADGHIYFSYESCPLCTAERVTYEDILDVSIITKTLNSEE